MKALWSELPLYRKSWFDLYLGHAFYASLLLWLGLYIMEPQFFQRGFFATLLLVTHYMLLSQLGPWSFYLSQSPLGSLLYVFQMFCLFGIGFGHHHIGSFYLGLIPLIFGVFYHSYLSDKNQLEKINRRKNLLLLAIGGVLYFAFWEISGFQLISRGEIIEAMTFTFWLLSMAYYGKSYIDRKMTKEYRRRITDEQTEKHFLKDLRLFHHVHEKLLHQYAHISESTVDHKQSLFESHRNIIFMLNEYLGEGKTHNSMTLVEAKVKVFHLYHALYGHDSTQVEFVFQEPWEKGQAEGQQKVIQQTGLVRIALNLFKMFQAMGSERAEIIFSSQGDWIKIQATNKLLDWNRNHQNLAKDLSRIILDERSHLSVMSESIESLQTICKHLNGQHEFKVGPNYWQNVIMLPIVDRNDSGNTSLKVA